MYGLSFLHTNAQDFFVDKKGGFIYFYGRKSLLH